MSLPSKAELEGSLKGAFQLLLQKPEGMELLDVSERGYWRSFYAAFYGLPLLMLAAFIVSPGPESQEAAAEGGNLLFNLIGFLLFYVINWLYWPLAAVYVTRNLGRFDRYAGYIVAYNWAQLFALLAQVTAFVIGAMIFGNAEALLFPAGLLALAINWSVARHALGIAALPAVVLTALDFFIGAGLNMFPALMTG